MVRGVCKRVCEGDEQGAGVESRQELTLLTKDLTGSDDVLLLDENVGRLESRLVRKVDTCFTEQRRQVVDDAVFVCSTSIKISAGQ